MPGTNGDKQNWFEKKDRISMWQTLLPGLSRQDVETITRLPFGIFTGKVNGRDALLLTTQADHNDAVIMLQAKLTVGDRYCEITAYNTDSSNNQPRFGPFFRLHHIETGHVKDGEETGKITYKAPPPIGQSVTRLFNATGLRRQITPLQMEATAAVLSYVLRQFRAKAPVQMVDIAPIFEPKTLKKLPPVSSWRIHAGRLASIKRASQRHKQDQTP